MNLAELLRQLWPNRSQRAVVVQQYRTLAHRKELLADVALRGGVYAAREPKSEIDAYIDIGRRQMALEFLNLVGADPAVLLAEAQIRRPDKTQVDP